MTGDLLLGIGLFASLSSMIGFFAYQGENEKITRLCNLAVEVTAGGALAASAYLMYLIMTDDFGVEYVASYSSLDLAFVYKIAAFWAGQQGSFLLWVLIHSIVGLMIYQNKAISHRGMAVYMLLASLLIIMTLGKSPFAPTEVYMADGFGMNPLLQDPWMAIHPPVVFLGYALLAVPFAIGVGALLENQPNKEWLDMARKWTLAAWAFLGAGIFIGGYWAYKVLGWGGYWGWDPVENSSLVPWLLAGIYLHILKVVKVRPGASAMLHVAGIFTYSAVIYGTFLTRSGILGDFSVHSFSGTTIGVMIAVINGALLAISLLILTARANRLPSGKIYENYSSREFLVLLGSLIMVFIAAVVFVGMSMPLLTQLIGSPAAVDTSFYERLTMPLAVVMMIGLTMACIYGFGNSGIPIIKAKVPVIVAAVAGAGAVLAIGVREPLAIILGAVALAGVMASVMAHRQRLLSMGGCVAHVGLGLGLLSMMLAGTGSQTVSQEMVLGEKYQVLGHTIEYKGQDFNQDADYKEYVYEIDGSEQRAMTKLRKNGEDAAREPAIYRGLMGDVYVAPSPAKVEGTFELVLKHGGMDMDDNLAYRYEGVTMEPDPDNPDITIVTAKIAVTDGNDVEEAYPVILATKTGGTSKPIPVMNGQKQIRLTGISGDQRSARIETLPSTSELSAVPVVASVSTKPFIWLLWLASTLVVVGCFAAIGKRVSR